MSRDIYEASLKYLQHAAGADWVIWAMRYKWVMASLGEDQ